MARDPRLVAGVVALVAISMISAVVLWSDNSSAAEGPKAIRGYVRDSAGYPVAGANVTVKSFTSAHALIKTLWYDSTESDGFYTVTFGNTEWAEDGSFEVTALYSIYSNTNSSAADPNPFQNIDVTLGVAIPELGPMTTVLTVASLTAVVLVIMSRRRVRR